MNLNYKILSKNKKSKAGICYVLNEYTYILTECKFSISKMKIENKYHRTVLFTEWSHTTFDGKTKELEQFIIDNIENDIYVMCVYNQNIHSNFIEKDIKGDISKRILEFTNTTK